jgi:acetyl esterase/lipase
VEGKEMNLEERLNPELRSFISLLPDNMAKGWTLDTIGATRIEVPPTTDPAVNVSECFIPGPADSPEVRVKIYKPQNQEVLLPGVLYIHGGGYAMGTVEMFDPTCNNLVKEVNCVVISPDYRLAPENPYPAGLEDCYASLEWFVANAVELGVDLDRIAVTGASAGGGLTIAISLLARDRKGPKIHFQMPLYPTMDDRLLTPSSNEMNDGRVLNKETCEGIWNLYLGEGHKTKDISPYAAPSRAMDLSGLPPAYIFVGELDPHRDETLDYVTRLVQAGVPTGFTLYSGCFHGFDMMVPHAEVSKGATNISIQALRDALCK